MTRRKQAQRTLWEGVVDEDVRALYEPWMIEADRLLEDESLIDGVFAAQGERHKHSATKGRSQTPAEMVLRLLLLKHVRNWSFDTLEREVRANLVYRDFTRIGMGKVPDAKTLARIAQALGGAVIAELHRRLVEIAQEEGVIQGRKLRADTTVVETNIHYPTDSSLLGDGARVLTRTMKKIESAAGQLKRKVRDRRRSISKRVVAIATASRHKGAEGEAKRKRQYRELLRFSRQVLNDAKRVMKEVEQMSARKKKRLGGLVEYLGEMAGRVRQVVKQAKTRVFDGITQLPGKIVSLFEPHSEIIRKGKASKPTEFGKLVKIQEGETQIITDYEVYAKRPSDSELVIAALDAHEKRLGRIPRLVAGDPREELGVAVVVFVRDSSRHDVGLLLGFLAHLGDLRAQLVEPPDALLDVARRDVVDLDPRSLASRLDARLQPPVALRVHPDECGRQDALLGQDLQLLHRGPRVAGGELHAARRIGPCRRAIGTRRAQRSRARRHIAGKYCAGGRTSPRVAGGECRRAHIPGSAGAHSPAPGPAAMRHAGTGRGRACGASDRRRSPPDRRSRRGRAGRGPAQRSSCGFRRLWRP